MSDKLYHIDILLGIGSRRRLELHIDNQSFLIGEWHEDAPDRGFSAEITAEWYGKQLTEALDRLVVKAQNQVREADEEMKRMARQKVQEAIDVYLQGTFNIK